MVLKSCSEAKTLLTKIAILRNIRRSENDITLRLKKFVLLLRICEYGLHYNTSLLFYHDMVRNVETISVGF